MAWSTPKICATPRCGGLSTRDYCPDCKRARKRRHDRNRPNSNARGYGKAWQFIRRRILTRDFYCSTEGCRRRSTEVDHKIPREWGGSDDDENLQGLCKPCHSSKTARESAFGRGPSISRSAP